MNTVQNGKGDRPRNNWGPQWYAGYTAINWHPQAAETGDDQGTEPSTAAKNGAPLRNRLSPKLIQARGQI